MAHCIFENLVEAATLRDCQREIKNFERHFSNPPHDSKVVCFVRTMEDNLVAMAMFVYLHWIAVASFFLGFVVIWQILANIRRLIYSYKLIVALWEYFTGRINWLIIRWKYGQINFIYIKPDKPVRDADGKMKPFRELEGGHYMPEAYVPGSEYQSNCEVPKFQCAVYRLKPMVDGSRQAVYVGNAFWIDDFLVTNHHVLKGDELRLLNLKDDTKYLDIPRSLFTAVPGMDLAAIRVSSLKNFCKLGISKATVPKKDSNFNGSGYDFLQIS